MRFLSVCSGIEAASVAWNPLGWKAVAFSEIEPFPCALLAHHYPDTPNWGDMTKYKEWPDVSIDLLCGGTPCQSFSVAGLRKGLDDPRGNLMLTFGAIAAKYRPKWLVWENVPGVLSSNGGRDFGSFLGLLGVLGYGFAYRVLDAQYFGVAQRRRRVFVVGCLGDWRSAAAVLFERHSLQGHPAPSRKAGKAAPTIPSRSTAGGGLGTDFDCDGGVITMAHGQGGAEIGFDRGPTLTCNHEAPIAAYPVGVTIHGTDPTVQKVASYDELAQCLRARTPGNIDNSSTTVVQQPVAFQDTADCLTAAYGTKWNGNASATNGSLFVAQPVAYGIRTANTSSNGWGIQEECTHTLDCAQGVAVAVALRGREGGATAELGDEVQNCLRASGGGGDKPHVLHAMQVRRLTPVECEALQGFPRSYTAIPWRGKPADQCPDGPRYKALGNSWAVPVAHWIGRRIEAVEAIHAQQAREAA